MLSDDSRLTSKRSVKLAVVERATHNIGRDTAPAYKGDVSTFFVLQCVTNDCVNY